MRNQKGVTMISLIITIIVMVILAAVAVSMVTGDGAVVDKAKAGVSESNLAQAQEEVSAAWTDLEMGFWMNTTDTKRSDYFTAENLKGSLKEGEITELNYVIGGTTTGKYVKDGVEYPFEIDTTKHKTDGTANDAAIADSGNTNTTNTVVSDTTNEVTNTTEDTTITEPEGTVLSGTWKFNETINFENAINLHEKVNFTSNGVNYIAMEVFWQKNTLPSGSVVVDSESCVRYYERERQSAANGQTPYFGFAAYMYSLDKPTLGQMIWTEDYANDSIINFGTGYQEVSEEFYNWFIANATKN